MFADENFKFDENGRKFAQMGRKYFSHSVFNRLKPETHKHRGLFGKGLTALHILVVQAYYYYFFLHFYFFLLYKNALFNATSEVAKC